MRHTLRKQVQRSLLFAAAAAAGVATIAVSQLTAAPQAKTVWDGVYTEQQAARGAVSFAASCARCHSAEPNAGEEGKALAGPPFWQSHRESTVDRLLDFVSKSMPNGAAAGTLSASTYADVVAFILSRNGLPAGSAELTRASADGVKIIAKDGPGELPNGTLARVVGCVARKEGGGWILTRATAPERTQNSDGPGADDATRALGDRSYALMFMLTSLESSVGHRMSVRGLLIGDGGKNGINVSTTQSLSPSCQ
jgi:mono/diheme cytochrome c family protein